MTAVLPEPAVDLAGCSDGELAEILSAALETGDVATVAAIEAEAGRRDAADRQAEAARRAQERRTARQTAYFEVLHGEYLRASEACRGRLLSPAGMRAGIRETQLWQLGERDAMRFASEELHAWWDDHGRLTFRAWEAGTSEAAAQRYELDRQDREPEPAEPAEAEPVAEPEQAEPEQATETAPTEETPMKSECRHPWRSGPARCGDCPRRRAEQPAPPDPIAARTARREQRSEARAALRARIGTQTPVTGVVAVPEPAQTPAWAANAGQLATRDRPELDGDQVLRYARAFASHHLDASEAALDVLALWCGHANARDDSGRLLFEASPRLMFLSDQPGSGKSRALQLVRMLTGSRYGLITEPTAWGLAHVLGPERSTACIDEGDVLFGRGGRKEAVRAVLNAGYARDGVILHRSGKSTEALNVFGPISLAGLDAMKTATGASLEPLFDRSIVVRMRKAGRRVPQLDASARRSGDLLHAVMSAWCAQERSRIASAKPEIPEWLYGRAEEIWAPLFQIATVAGGPWPQRCAAAAEELAGGWDEEASAEVAGDAMDQLAELATQWA